MSDPQSQSPVAVFDSFDSARTGWSGIFSEPVAIHEAHHLEEVLPVLKETERATLAGRWAIVLLSYEAAPAFEPAMAAHPAGPFPLAWVGIFDSPVVLPASHGSGPRSNWVASISYGEYATAIASIRQSIARGDCYQVNYTFPLQCEFHGGSRAWYGELGAAQGAAYCAWVDIGSHDVLCLSPELFFEREGSRLWTRPMKGTLPRGRWNEEDEAQREQLRDSTKDRAENVMIVDLLRNDLGRISLPGSVQVTKLFEVERYETLFQMTSTIESICQPHIGLTDLLRALFPCGSVTGAPKISAMSVIRDLEASPRGLYTGAIGLIRPGGDCTFNVPIRTLILDKKAGRVTFGVGGGITSDSTPENEYAECLTKARFLSRRRPAFELLETLLLEAGEYFLLERHISRMQASADYFSFVWDEKDTRVELERIQHAHPQGRWRVRLLARRDGHYRAEAIPLAATAEKVWRVGWAPQPLDSSEPFLFHKTTHRSFYEQPLPSRPDCDDLIFCNEHGQITESSIANVVVVIGKQKFTPPRSSGLLAGTFRAELLAHGKIHERVLTKQDLRQAHEVYLINSVRKWVRAELLDV